MRLRFGITEKLIIVIVASVLLLMVVAGYYSFKYQKNLLLSQFDERAIVMITGLAVSSEYPVLTANDKLLESLAVSVLKQKDVVLCQVKDKAGKILFHRGETNKVRSIRSYVASVMTQQSAASLDEMVLGVQKEVKEKIGEVYLVLSLDRIMEEMNKQRNFIILLTLIGMVLIFVFISYFIRAILGRPIRELVKGTNRISSGDLGYKVPVKTQDEIGVLALSFNAMTDDLQRVTVSRDSLLSEINERKRAEAALRDAESQQRTLIKNIPQKIFYKDTSSVYILCNESYAIDLKINPRDIKGKTDYDFFPRELAYEYIKGDQETMFSRNVMYREEEYVNGGQKVTVETVKAPVKDDAGNVIGVFGIFWDITDRKRAEEELKNAYEQLKNVQAQAVQSAKMASMGLLAGGVAHEINNPLAGVLNNVQMIKMLAEQKKDFSFNDFREILAVIEESAARCKKITQSLLNFSRTSKGAFHSVSLNDSIEQVVIIIGHELKLQNVTIRKELQPDLPLIMGDAQLLQQVIFDLINNSKWAIQQKKVSGGEGVIILKTAYILGEKKIVFSVDDTGIGIDKDNLSKIFEPFFTTKPVGEGTGLGLSIIYNIIKAHHGNIEVESIIGQGTTFKIMLPVI
jgi:PAS domain S-box-containing protein